MSTIDQSRQFARMVNGAAAKQLTALLGTDAGKKAASRITMAFASAMSNARDPSAFLRCSQESVVACIATSVDMDLYPGGPNPAVYLVPKGGTLQWRITHMGLSILAQRAGYSLMAIPVHKNDHLVVEFYEALKHRGDPSDWPKSLDDMLGVVVSLRRLSDGVLICRPWVPRAVIEERREKSQMSNRGPWRDWPVEMAMKTAILFANARGWLPIDSTDIAVAVEAENREAEGEDSSQAPAQPRKSTLGLPDRQAERDLEQEEIDNLTGNGQPEPEPVVIDAKSEPAPKARTSPEPKRANKPEPAPEPDVAPGPPDDVYAHDGDDDLFA